MKCFAVIPCAGVGERAGAAGPKQYAELAGRPLVAHTLAALAAVEELEATLVVLAPQDRTFAERVAPRKGLWAAGVGGSTRAASVRAGLAELRRRGAADDDWVLVHDAARCLVTPALVKRLIDACRDDEVGGLLALPLTDTLKHGAQGQCLGTLARADKWLAQTPQMFRLAVLERALDASADAVTDEASAVEALGLRPRLVPGSLENLKITWPADFELAGRWLEARQTMDKGMLRIGEGWDTHALVLGRPLVLGGVNIPHTHGLQGHSDADALLHAITDAVLGGAGLGDIGRHFPDTDAAFAGADSAVLLREAVQRARAAGWRPSNVDATIVAQAPRLAPYVDAMRERIAEVMGLPAGAVNVKAKTAEGMGPVGEGRAIEARAVCLLAAV